MPSSHICNICDKIFSAKPNLKRHIQNAHGKGQRVQCPYCNKTRTRVDDLIRHHIVNNHPEKVAEVAKDKTIIKTVSASNHSPEKKAKKGNESSAASKSTTKKDKPERSETETILGPLIGRPISPLKSPPHNSDSIQGSPSLFQRLDNMITLAGGQAEVVRQSETEQAVASILPTQQEAPMETSPQGDEPPVDEKPDADILIPREAVTVIGIATGPRDVHAPVVEGTAGGPNRSEVGDMYIPNCETAATQYSPQKEVPSVEPNPPAEPILIIPPPQAQPIFHNPLYLESHCPHGIKIPTHIHIRRTVKKPNGEVVKTKEILVNCARCPPPVIHMVAKVDPTTMRQATQSRPSSVFSSSTRETYSSIMSDSDSD